MSQKNSENLTFTYQARLPLDHQGTLIFSHFALLMNKVEHSLFADIARGKKSFDLKSSYLKEFKITARHFNSVRSVLEGKISSVKEREKEDIASTKARISALESKIKKLIKKKANPRILHEKKRRYATLKARLQSKEKDAELGKIRLCFGSRKLFRKQFDLKANAYSSQDEWKKEWEDARSNNFFLIGSKDETAGNQSCVATLEGNSLSLRIRLPDALSEYGKYLVIEGIQLSYGQDAIVQALISEESVAISYRFVRDHKGWRVFISVPVKKQASVTRTGIGVIGVDINANHLAVVETDRYGNPIARKSFPLCTYGKTRHQASALVGDVAKSIIDWCLKAKKPLVLEKLSFSKKKCELREISSPKYARMLSSFAYNSIISTLKSRAFRSGVHVRDVNPAYTSVIGRVKFSRRYGFSVHESAALVIGRRFLGNSERLPRHQAIVPDGKGGYLTLPLPARNRGRHVWTLWGLAKRNLLKWCLQHTSGRKKLSSSRILPACCDMRFSDLVGETPAHESTTELLGGRV